MNGGRKEDVYEIEIRKVDKGRKMKGGRKEGEGRRERTKAGE